jgi:two-component system, OmpR family, sensor histidine kinase VicK
MGDSLRVLIVEDSLEDAFFIVNELCRGGFDVLPERVDSAMAMQVALEAHAWDAVICDYSLPGFGGAEALTLYQKKHLDAPFILVSGVMGEHLAVEMIKAGAHNYVMKDQLDRLVPVVQQELRAVQDRRVRKQAEASAAYAASLVESCDQAIIGTDLGSTVLSWNLGAQRLFGFTATDVIGRSIAMLIPAYRPDDWSEVLQKIVQGGHVDAYETQWLRKDGTPVEVLLTASPVKTTNEPVRGVSVVAHDISRRKLDENDRLALIQELTAALSHMPNQKIQSTRRR